ncbi:MAG: hypothetical protein Q4C65_09650, partial [Eubacteriales bacterium]|nr:hypothetical protein [Eubacteriales bacterium]
LRELIGVMKRCRDKEALLRYCNENADRFHQLDDETYDVICTMINAKRLLKQKEKYKKDGKEGNDMCKALNDLMKDSRREGWLEGRNEGEKVGRIEGEKAGRIEGEKAGIVKGEIRGEELFGKLASCLLGQKRYSDLEEAAKNAVVRSRLYREFHLRA